jgi:hypothetical protein
MHTRTHRHARTHTHTHNLLEVAQPELVCIPVVVGSPAARARCPVTNPSDQPLCFEVIVQRAAEDEGKAAGTVRIDHGDEELQLLNNFNLCQFVEEETRPQEAGADGDTGLDEGVTDARASLGGAVAIKLLLQPRARLEVPNPSSGFADDEAVPLNGAP